jgi:hypothetical protein
LRINLAKSRVIETALLATAALLTVWLLATITSRTILAYGGVFPELLPTQPEGDAAGRTAKIHNDLAARVTARNLFAPTIQGFQGQLTGVLGDQAVFGNQFVGVGENVMGATLKAIGPDWAEIEFEGKTQRLSLFDSALQGGGPSGLPAGMGSMRAMRGGPGERPQRGERGPRGRPRDGDMPRSDRNLETLRQMDPETRERILNSMPPETADQIRSQL